ncbi:MAG TPA: hypothetical protein VM884_08955 [Flavisolibacter sp.]|jgi:hypothetical protein|nr:hypothetical protein [Flavisolibacter sp.]
MLYLISDPITSQLDLMYLVLACVGIIIILGCIGAYLFGYGGAFKDKIQEISAFGADMKISVVTVFILVGVGFIVPLVWTSFNDAVRTLNHSKETLMNEKDKALRERDQLRILLDQANAKRTRDQVYFLELEGIAETETFKKEDIQVVYYDFNSEAPQVLEHELTPGRKRRVKVLFKNITDDTEFPSLEVINKKTEQRWFIEEFKPCRPSLTLKKSINEL